MAKEVETRVVQMKFDNKQFQKNIDETLSSLKQLDKELKFEDASKGFDKIAQASRNVSLGVFGDAVDSVKFKFNALEIAAITAITNITNKAINAGERLVKSLSVDNIAAGWSKFEDTTTSVGTLISQGFRMDEVEEQLNKLNWFTDETSYNFTEMVNNIGKFTATGAGLGDSVQAMMGIANWAALSGQNAQKASMAMYQLSQAMSKGVLKYDDWKSISNASMDTKEFRQNAAEAAAKIGTLKKNADGTYTTLKNHIVSLNDLFSSDYMSRDAWFTKEVMMDTFTKYSSAVDQIYEKVDAGEFATASDAIAAMGDQIDEFGLKAFKAAQEARTWTDVVASVKDAVSSKWKETFELIVGNYEEAKRLFTAMANGLYDIFAEGGNKRNSILSVWKELGGREKLLNGILAIILAIKNTLQSISDTWRNIFLNGMKEEDAIIDKANKLYSLTERFEIAAFKLLNFFERNLPNIQSLFSGIFSVVKLIKDAFNAVIKMIFPGTHSISSLGQVLMNLIGVIGRLLERFTEWIREGKIITIITTAIGTVVKFLTNVILVIIGTISILCSRIKEVAYRLKQLDPVRKILTAITTVLSMFVIGILYAIESVKNFIKVITTPELARESDNPIVKALVAINNAFMKIGAGVSVAINAIKNLIASIKGLPILDKLKTIKEFFTETLFGNPESGASKFLEVLNKIKVALDAFLGKLDVGKIVAIAFTVSMIGVAGALASLLKASTGLVGNLSGLTKTLRNVLMKTYAKTVGILNIAEAFAILAASLFLLSKANQDDLKKVIDQVVRLVLVMGGVYTGMLLITGILKKFELASTMNEAFDSVGKVILSLSVSMVALAAALWILQGINVSMDLVKSLGLVLGAVTVMGLIAVAISRLSSKNVAKALGASLVILVLSTTLKKVVEAIKELTTVAPEKVAAGVKAFVPIFMAFGVLAIGAGQIRISTVLSLLLLAKLLQQVIPEMAAIGENISTSELATAAQKISDAILVGDVLTVLFAVLTVLALRGKQIGQATKGISMLLLAITGLFGLLWFMSSHNFKLSWDVLNAFVAISLVIMAFEALATFTSESKMLSFSTSMVILTTALAGMVVVVGMLKAMKLTVADTYPLLALLGAVAVLEAMSALTKFSKILPLIAIFAGIHAVLGSILALSLVADEGGMQNAIEAVTASIVGIATLVSLISLAGLVNKAAGLKAFALMIGSLGIAAAALAGAVKLLEGMTFDGAIEAFKILGTILGSLLVATGLMAVVSHWAKAKEILASAVVIGALTFALGAVSGLIFVLQSITWTSDLAKSCLVLAAFFAAIAMTAIAIEGFSKSANADTIKGVAKVINALTISLAAVGAMIFVLQYVKWSDDLNKTLWALGLLLGEIGVVAIALTWLAKRWSDKTLDSSVKIIKQLTITFAVLGGMLYLLKYLKWDADLSKSVLALGLLLLEIGGLAIAMEGLSKKANADVLNKVIGILVVFEIMIATLGVTFYALKDVDQNTIYAAGTALAKVVGVIGLMTVALTALTAWKKINAGTLLVIGGVVLAMSVLVYNLGKAFERMASIKGDIEEARKALDGVILSLGAVTAVLALIAGLIPSGMGAAGLIIAAAAIGVLSLAIIGIATSFTKFANSIKELQQAMAANPIKNAVDQIMYATKNINQEAVYKASYDVGLNFVKGFSDGVEKNLGLVETAVDKMVQIANGAVTTGLQEQSPSKLEYQNGAYFVLGFANGIADGIPTASEAGSNLSTAVNAPIIGGVAGTISVVGSLFGELLTTVFGAVEEVSTTVEEGIQGTVNIAEEEVPKVNTIVEEGSENLNKEVASNYEELEEETDVAASWIENRWNQAWNNAFAGIATFLHGGDSIYKDYAKKANNELQKNFNNTVSKTVSSGFSNAVSDTLASYGIDTSKFSGIVTSVKNAAAKGKEVVKDFFGGDFSYEGIMKKVEEYKNSLGLNIDTSSLDAYKDALEGVASGYDTAASSAANAKSVFSELQDTISSQMDIFSRFNDETSISAQDMLDNMKSQIFGINSWANNLARLSMRGLNADLLKQLGDLGPQGYAKVAAFAEMTDEQLQEANYLYSAAMKLPGYAAEEVSSSYQYAGELAVKGYSNALDKFKGLMKATELGTVTIEDINTAVNNTLPMLQTTLNTGFKKAAKYAKDGFTEEMQNDQKVTKVIEGFGNKAVTTLNRTLEIQSPSKLTAETAKYFVQGFDNGITDNEPSAIANVTTMGERLTDSIRNSINYAMSLMENTSEFQPVMTPVLNLSEIQNGVNAMGSMMYSQELGIATNAKLEANVEAARAAQQQALYFKGVNDAINNCSAQIVDAIIATDKPVNVNVTLQGDSAGLFKMVRQENAKFSKINGYNALTQN